MDRRAQRAFGRGTDRHRPSCDFMAVITREDAKLGAGGGVGIFSKVL